MNVNRVTKICKITFLLLAMSSMALSQSYSENWDDSNSGPVARSSAEYTLGWQDTQDAAQVSTSPCNLATAVEVPVAVNLAALPQLISASSLPEVGEVAVAPAFVDPGRTRALRGPSPVPVPTHDIVLHADRYFDTYADNYRYVHRVEVVTYRGDFPRTEVYENPAQYSTFDVYINDLKVGDRFEVRVTWDDGNYRIIDRSVGRYVERHVRVSTPG